MGCIPMPFHGVRDAAWAAFCNIPGNQGSILRIKRAPQCLVAVSATHSQPDRGAGSQGCRGDAARKCGLWCCGDLSRAPPRQVGPAISARQCHVVMAAMPCRDGCHAMPCHVLIPAMPCHVVMAAMRCHVVMAAMACHVVMAAMPCHVVMAAMPCHVVMAAMPSRDGCHAMS